LLSFQFVIQFNKESKKIGYINIVDFLFIVVLQCITL